MGELEETTELKLDFTKLDADFLKVASAPVFQRLGYLLDRVLEEESIADGLLALMKSGGMKMKAVPLKLGASFDDAEVDRKWKVVVNQDIEIDDGAMCGLYYMDEKIYQTSTAAATDEL